MKVNRSMPSVTVIPELSYEDVNEAIEWLSDVFGLSLRLRIANHRAQLVIGNGAVIIKKQQSGLGEKCIHSLLVRIEDLDGHYQIALQKGAQILSTPTTYPYGERQYTAVDLGGHVWTFSQTVADVNPEEWGGILVKGN